MRMQLGPYWYLRTYVWYVYQNVCSRKMMRFSRDLRRHNCIVRGHVRSISDSSPSQEHNSEFRDGHIRATRGMILVSVEGRSKCDIGGIRTHAYEDNGLNVAP